MKDLLRLWRLMRPYRNWMLLGILLSLVTLFANVVLMAISGWFIAAMALAGAAGVSMNYFTPAAIIRAMAITRTVGRYLERLVTHEATFRLLSQLRVWFYEKLEPLAPAGLQDTRSGDLLSRLRADIDTLENFYLRFLVPVAVAALAVPAIAAFLSMYSPMLALSVLALLLVAGLAVPLLTERLGRNAARRQVREAARMRTHLVEGQQGLSELLTYRAFDRHRDEIERMSAALTKDQKDLSALDGLSQGALILCASFSVFFVLLFAIPLVGAGALSPPLLAMLALLALAAFESVTALPQAFRSLPMVRTALGRIFEIADRRPLVAEPEQPLPAPKRGEIEMRGVQFGYEKDRPVLRNIDFSLSAGKKLAIIGPTGSGKSTVASLLLGFWQPQAGDILIDGRPSCEYASEDVRALFAVVPQRVHLFNTTIRANLLLGRPQAGQEELETACRTARIHDFIVSQPEGYDTFVGEGGLKLSGGQIRRIALARALLKPAPVLILDEPGESLDPALEHEVIARVLKAERERSVVLITHSLTGLELMDGVLLLQEGRIAAKGSHTDLLRTNELYRGLHNLLGEFT